MIRILLVDDHPVVREGLAAVLAEEPDLVVVGQAGTLAEARQRTEVQEPDVVLLDLELPDGEGTSLLAELPDGEGTSLLAELPAALVFTAFGDDGRVATALRKGARGYLLKGASADEIARAIRTVHAGGVYLDPRVASTLARAVSAPRTEAPAPLTAREREVLRLVVEGLSNKQAARALGIAERTVKFHLSALLRKTGAVSRAQLAVRAVQERLLR